jgi:hypothetical protein
LSVVDQPTPAELDETELPTPFEKAVFMEQIDEDAAIRAYQSIIADDPSHIDARVNSGGCCTSPATTSAASAPIAKPSMCAATTRCCTSTWPCCSRSARG